MNKQSIPFQRLPINFKMPSSNHLLNILEITYLTKFLSRNSLVFSSYQHPSFSSHENLLLFFARIGRGNSGTESRWNQCWNCNRRWRTVRLERGRSGEMPLTVTRGNPCRVPASIQVLSKRPSPALPPRGRSKIRLYRGNWNAVDSIRKQIPSNRSLGRHLARISPHSFANVLLYVMRRFI